VPRFRVNGGGSLVLGTSCTFTSTVHRVPASYLYLYKNSVSSTVAQLGAIRTCGVYCITLPWQDVEHTRRILHAPGIVIAAQGSSTLVLVLLTRQILPNHRKKREHLEIVVPNNTWYSSTIMLVCGSYIQYFFLDGTAVLYFCSSYFKSGQSVQHATTG
jgi:hypothetical protein